MKINWPKVADVGERTLATFAQAFLAIVLITGVSDRKALIAGAVAGGIAAAKYATVQINLWLASDG